ncbi:MAG: MurT ligase domain-containing protein [Oscillospiraceae bacterium]
MGKFRFLFALWMAKLSRPALKITKHNGTNFPGELALKLCPDFLEYIGKPGRIIAVTGTNGKTTVSNMLCDILESRGEMILNNRAGSNIASGISTSLIIGASLFGKAKYSTAVFEVDERSSLKIYPYVRPDLVVITNLFRDSIMRNAHPAYIADILSQAIPKTAKLVLNADDLISSGVSPENDRAYFGIDKMETDRTNCINLINDMRICPKCSGTLDYEYLRYHHIGKARCSVCGFESPPYDFAAENVDFDSMSMDIVHGGETCGVKLLSDSIFNVYNMVTVIAALCQLGFSLVEATADMEKTKIVETRHNEEDVGNIRLVMQMAKEKNALAVSRAFDYVASRPGRKELFLMMNCLGDVKHWSENTCWLYDCDFEFLASGDISQIVVTGSRAKDYRLRLLLAGVPDEKIYCEMDEFKASELLNFTPGDSVYVFYGTDSLTLALRVRERIAHLAEEAAK